MDAMHEKGVKAFPAKPEGKGNQLREGVVGHVAVGAGHGAVTGALPGIRSAPA
jgi:hypothetical protein